MVNHVDKLLPSRIVFLSGRWLRKTCISSAALEFMRCLFCCNQHGDCSMKPSYHQDRRLPAKNSSTEAISQETKVAKQLNLKLGETIPEIHDLL